MSQSDYILDNYKIVIEYVINGQPHLLAHFELPDALHHEELFLLE